MLDMVSLSFKVTALKYLFKRPCSGFGEQAGMVKNATRRPITINVLLRIVPPSSIVPTLLSVNHNFIPEEKSSPFLPRAARYLLFY
jgi:hypothetical protein